MTPPPKLTPEQCEQMRQQHHIAISNDDFRAIEAARDRQWTEMLAGQEPNYEVLDEENERFSLDVSNFKGADPEATKYALEQFLKSRTHPHPDDTALLRQALEMLEDNHHHIAEHERHAYVMQHLALIEALKERLK